MTPACLPGHAGAGRVAEERSRSTFQGLELLDLALRSAGSALVHYPEALALVTTEAFRGVCLSVSRRAALVRPG